MSQKRADAVYKYLIKKGIEKKQLFIKEMGFSKPIAPNTKPDGSDNPEGRAKNRRFEFLLINMRP